MDRGRLGQKLNCLGLGLGKIKLGIFNCSWYRGTLGAWEYERWSSVCRVACGWGREGAQIEGEEQRMELRTGALEADD